MSCHAPLPAFARVRAQSNITLKLSARTVDLTTCVAQRRALMHSASFDPERVVRIVDPELLAVALDANCGAIPSASLAPLIGIRAKLVSQIVRASGNGGADLPASATVEFLDDRPVGD